MEKTLTIADVAERLQLSTSTIYKYAEQGRIPSMKIGTRRRFLEGELNEYLLSCQTNINSKEQKNE
jgi:PTS system nitrogen regulatory IIA component